MSLEGAWLPPDAHAVILFSQRPGSEGCEGTDPTQISIIAVP